MLSSFGRILIVEAHPDDIEVSMGMTLSRLADCGANVELVVCTDGGLNGETSLRKRESQATCALLGIKNVHHLGFMDGSLLNNIVYLWSKIEEVIDAEYDVVFLHSPRDRHQDHRAVASLVVFIPDVPSVFYFESPSVMTDFCPNLFVLGDRELADRKKQLMKLHKSQLAGNRIYHLRRTDSGLEYWGERVMPYKHNVYAEAFEISRMGVLPKHDGYNLIIANSMKDSSMADVIASNLSPNIVMEMSLISKGIKENILEIEGRISGLDIQSLFIPRKDDLGYAVIAAAREHPANIFVYREFIDEPTVDVGGIRVGIDQIVVE